MPAQILYVTDGSPSAREAGLTALELAGLWNASIRAVFIIDQSWAHILGDEWMSGAVTRAKFFSWLGEGLQKQASAVLDEFCDLAKSRQVQVQKQLLAGNTAKLLISLAREADLLVLPNPYAAGHPAEAGLKFNLNKLLRAIKCPVWLGGNMSRGRGC
ncbi:Universal stress protein family protein [Desulfotomaculum arcticum]|uniref:Universal stress protein family protein n=1 Tax=Desulfotruncus arcticus DSM 17038 TaxID=1121424 RepID=A0A1I2PIM1_9FIRM|nr:universal stress protein [Desulfotruncus arcticus]SFG13847.1 Universal stress protein family protein [Desulfotomaculum arcticum] [Desulfotruncus arcticus DSM 17038]